MASYKLQAASCKGLLEAWSLTLKADGWRLTADSFGSTRVP
jgi:hypothetical protein